MHISIKHTSVGSKSLNLSEILSRQNWAGKLAFLLSALNVKIYFPLTMKYLFPAL